MLPVVPPSLIFEDIDTQEVVFIIIIIEKVR